MRILLQDLTDRGAPGLGRPGSISLLRVATGVGLTRFGHEPGETGDDDPELALVDALDVPTEDALEVVEGHCDRSLPVVVRVHGGWRTGDAAPATGHPSDASVEEQQRRTQRLLDLGDRLLVSSRSHLVRLAGHHTIDTSRVKLLAPPHPGFAPARVRGRRRGQAGHVVLALGDGDLDVLQHALPATVRITRPAAAPHDVAEVDAFRVAVAAADVVALAEQLGRRIGRVGESGETSQIERVDPLAGRGQPSVGLTDGHGGTLTVAGSQRRAQPASDDRCRTPHTSPTLRPRWLVPSNHGLASLEPSLPSVVPSAPPSGPPPSSAPRRCPVTTSSRRPRWR